MRITSAGRLGIGTTSPDRQVELYGANDAYMKFDGGRTGNHGFTIGSDGSGFIIYDDTIGQYRVAIDQDSGNVGIGTAAPKDTFHIATDTNGDGFAFGAKDLSLTTSYNSGAQLEIGLADHEGCYVKVFITGDWSGHSAIAFLGEYFIQNGANGYAEPGLIIREVENTHGSDSLSSQIYDGGNYNSFQIQFKLNASSGTATGKMTYQVMGQFDTIT